MITFNEIGFMKKYIYLFSALILNTFYGFAQMTHADSSFVNSISGEQTYISYWYKPGVWHVNSEVSSLPNLYDQIDNDYPFATSDFDNCNQSIITEDSLKEVTLVNETINHYEDSLNITVYGLHKPFRQLNFSLGTKSGKTFALMDSSHVLSPQHDIAFLVITGTGTNLAKSILDGSGYHNTNCFTNNLINKLGDVFVPIVPNDELRAIYFNRKKLSSTGSSTGVPYLLNYLNASGRAYGVNRLIETVAWIKYLKKTYKRVVVLGLSTGGKVAHWSALMAEPDAAIISSGYSILVDNDLNSQLVNSMSYGNYLLVFNKDSIRNRTTQLKTQLLLTLPQNDSWLPQLDIDSSYTKNFYQGVGNVSFFYNYVNHAFPPCNTMDTFLQRVLSMPKVMSSIDSSLCNKDSLVLNLHFDGQPPFQFQLLKDGQSQGSFSSTSNSFAVSLLAEGTYIIDSLVDGLGRKGYRSDSIFYVKHAAPDFLNLSHHFLCDSQKNVIEFQCAGTSPWTLFYSNNSSLDSLQFNQSSANLLWPNGTYHFLKLRDAHNCEVQISDSLYLANQLSNAMIQSITYDCALQENVIHLQLSGNFPMVLTYYDASKQQSATRILTSLQNALQFDNGDYHFLNIEDSNHCLLSFDTVLHLHTVPISLSLGNMNYICGLPYTSLAYFQTGTPPFAFKIEDQLGVRLKSSMALQDTLQLMPGQTIIHELSDANGCIVKLKDSIVDNPNKPILIDAPQIDFNCESKQYDLKINMDAAFPLRAHCRLNDSSFMFITATQENELHIAAGQFRIDSVHDANTCYLNGLVDTVLNNPIPSSFQLQQHQFTLSAPKTSLGHHYRWIRNDMIIQVGSDSVLSITKSGRYSVEIIDPMNCPFRSEILDVQLENGQIYPNPFTDKLQVFLEKDPGEVVELSICDLAGRRMQQASITSNVTQLNFQDLPKGIYVIHFYTNSTYKRYLSKQLLKK